MKKILITLGIALTTTIAFAANYEGSDLYNLLNSQNFVIQPVASTTNPVATNAVFTNASTTNASTTNGTVTNLFFTSATGTSLIITNASSTGLTATSLFTSHFKGVSSAPTIATSTGVGTGSGSSVSIAGTDLAGFVNIKTTNAPVVNGTIVTVTFNSSYGSAPFCVLTSATTSTATVWATTTTNTLLIKSNTALIGTSTYAWYYHCIQ